MKISTLRYDLHLEFPFRIAHGVRSKTPVVFIKISHDGHEGIGEASLPPYLGETVESVEQFISRLNLPQPVSFDVGEYLNRIPEFSIHGNYAAKAALDIAIHDLFGKIRGVPVSAMLGIDTSISPDFCMTIGIDEPEVLEQKVRKAADFNLLKIKLDGENDHLVVLSIKELSHKSFLVDVNEGWTGKEVAIDKIHWLKAHGCIAIEQPLPAAMTKDLEWLRAESPLPIFADEAIKNLDDLNKFQHLYHGVNIKLMKCGGINAAHQLIRKAKEYGLKIFMGCMTESSCATLAASHLAPLADLADLDGPFLISNNPFVTPELRNGKVVTPALPGIGMIRNENIELFPPVGNHFAG